MGVQLRITGAAVALTLLAQAASAQDEPQGNKVILPPIDVSSSRLGGDITGASTTIISSEDLQRAPESTLQDILSREAGIQTTSLYGGVNGTYTNEVFAGNSTNATIPGLVPGATYYFAATTYSSLSVESALSSAVAYTVSILARVQFRVTPTRQFVLTVTGPVGHTYNIQATQDFKTWTVIGTATVGAGGSLNFTNTNAASFSRRFYRTQG